MNRKSLQVRAITALALLHATAHALDYDCEYEGYLSRSGVAAWIDVDTPLGVPTKVSPRGEVWDLVMSDEIEIEGGWRQCCHRATASTVCKARRAISRRLLPRRPGRDANADLGLIDGKGHLHCGINYNGTCFPVANGYIGAFLCDSDARNLKSFTFTKSSALADWVLGESGYVRWMLEGAPLFAYSVHQHHVGRYYDRVCKQSGRS
ncbi:hypothetical protein H310_14496 [Aphanomyces invadans]|uniref:Uncharacterized protein n=1 Tax=Aphanomyces invadans TaxID=157072 RepID=A0A024T9N8_9STRA|nr:hypothetical protein H310_14496 [Aphanomyces invadans]ETV90758.1 hypothetical protein H310_14496 [Aphanomyces invadans]|eukprot:XP_008880594.1 hypothetical protein H310_14496 [Aphanomyces invadans]